MKSIGSRIISVIGGLCLLWPMPASAAGPLPGGLVDRLLDGIIQNLGILIPALIGLAILYADYRLKRRMYEDAARERAEHSDWLKREEIQITEIGPLIAGKVAQELRSETKWAQEALERAKLGPNSQTVFGERLDHFRPEKNEISRNFIPLLLARCRKHIENGKKVVLVLDSGTTLFPFFEEIGAKAVDARLDREDWIKDVTLVTNNLPGVESLIHYGRVNPLKRYSDLEIRCQLLPGTPLPIYGAVTGDETNKALQRVRDSSTDAIFIALTTGNWIRISSTVPRCPLPLARGDGHLPFKQKLIDIADEVYVVSPLGKIFVNMENSDLNDALGFSSASRTKDGAPYGDVEVDNRRAASIRLISTARLGHRLLYAHSEVVRNTLQPYLGLPKQFVDVGSRVGCHLLFTFDSLPDVPQLELKAEFPHPATRTPKMLQECFQVDQLRTKGAVASPG